MRDFDSAYDRCGSVAPRTIRTSRQRMSAFAPKTDIDRHDRYVRLVPKADIGRDNRLMIFVIFATVPSVERQLAECVSAWPFA
jgi:hypothetical protein